MSFQQQRLANGLWLGEKRVPEVDACRFDLLDVDHAEPSPYLLQRFLDEDDVGGLLKGGPLRFVADPSRLRLPPRR